MRQRHKKDKCDPSRCIKICGFSSQGRKGNVNVVGQSNVVTLLRKDDCNSDYPELFKKMSSNGTDKEKV